MRRETMRFEKLEIRNKRLEVRRRKIESESQKLEIGEARRGGRKNKARGTCLALAERPEIIDKR